MVLFGGWCCPWGGAVPRVVLSRGWCCPEDGATWVGAVMLFGGGAVQGVVLSRVDAIHGVLSRAGDVQGSAVLSITAGDIITLPPNVYR